MLSKRSLLEQSLQVARIVQPLLYHSTFQTAYFQTWVAEHLSIEQKALLSNLTKELINILFKIKILPNTHHVDNQHRWFLQLKKNIHDQCEKASILLESVNINLGERTNPLVMINAINMLVKSLNTSDVDGTVELIDGMVIETYQTLKKVELRKQHPTLTDEIETFLEKTSELLQLRDKLIHLQLDIRTLHSYQSAIAQLNMGNDSNLINLFTSRRALQIFYLMNADRFIDLNHHLLSVIEEIEFRNQLRVTKTRQSLFSITNKQQKIYEKACEFYRDKNYDEALPRFNKLAINFNHPLSLLKIGEMLIEGQGTSADPFSGCWYIQLACVYSKSHHFRHVALMKLEDMYLNRVTDPIQLDDSNKDNHPSVPFKELLKTLKSGRDLIERCFHLAETYFLLFNTELKRDNPNQQLALLYYQHAADCFLEAKKYHELHKDEFESENNLMSQFEELQTSFEHQVKKEDFLEAKRRLKFA